MLIEKEGEKRDGGGAVYVPHLNQAGTILGYVTPHQIRVRLASGSTVVLETSQVEHRQVLMG